MIHTNDPLKFELACGDECRRDERAMAAHCPPGELPQIDHEKLMSDMRLKELTRFIIQQRDLFASRASGEYFYKALDDERTRRICRVVADALGVGIAEAVKEKT